MRIRALALMVLMTLAGCAGQRQIHIDDDPVLNFRNAQSAYRHADYYRAGRLYDAAFAGGYRPFTWDLVMRAQCFVALHDFAAGEAWVRTVALARFPRNPELLEQRAILLDSMPGRRTEAVQIATEALTKDPHCCWAGYVIDHSKQHLIDCSRSARGEFLTQWQADAADREAAPPSN